LDGTGTNETKQFEPDVDWPKAKSSSMNIVLVQFRIFSYNHFPGLRDVRFRLSSMHHAAFLLPQVAQGRMKEGLFVQFARHDNSLSSLHTSGKMISDKFMAVIFEGYRDCQFSRSSAHCLMRLIRCAEIGCRGVSRPQRVAGSMSSHFSR